ncbi:UPF0223 family protein [bacterium]|nr:UPF0223 family protein [bacterium]
MAYDYPLDYETYSMEEIETIIDFLSYLEDNVKHYDFKTLKTKFDLYRKTVNSKKEEKRIDAEFQKLSGISIYRTLREFGLC